MRTCQVNWKKLTILNKKLVTLSIETFKWNFQANPNSKPSDNSGGACVASQPQCQDGQLFNPVIKSAYPLPVNAVLQCKRLGQNYRSTQPFDYRLKKTWLAHYHLLFFIPLLLGNLMMGTANQSWVLNVFGLKKNRERSVFWTRKNVGIFVWCHKMPKKGTNQGLIWPKFSLQAIQARSQNFSKKCLVQKKCTKKGVCLICADPALWQTSSKMGTQYVVSRNRACEVIPGKIIWKRNHAVSEKKCTNSWGFGFNVQVTAQACDSGSCCQKRFW